MSDLCNSKGIFDDLFCLFPVVLLAKPSSFANAFRSVCFLLPSIVPHCINSCSAHHSRALQPAIAQVREVCELCRSQSITAVELWSSNLDKGHLKARKGLGDKV